MGIVNIPEDVYHGYYQVMDNKHPDLDDESKWAAARKMMINTLKAALKGKLHPVKNETTLISDIKRFLSEQEVPDKQKMIKIQLAIRSFEEES
jgi:hypothetical protein